MNNLQESLITSSEQKQRFSLWEGAHEQLGIAPPEDTAFETWKEVIPRRDYGEVSITKSPTSFTEDFQEALRYGYVDDFLNEQTSKGSYDHIYIAKANDLDGEINKRVREQHSPEFLDSIEDRLIQLQSEIEGSDMPDEYKDEYGKVIADQKRFIRAARGLMTPEFTVHYNSPGGWAKLLDVDKSSAQNSAVLKYEDEAREVLKRSSERRKEEDVKAKDALGFWSLSEKEKEKLGYANISESANALSSEQTVRLFEILFDRLGLLERGWVVEIDESSKAVTVESTSKRLKIPANRQLSGWDIRNIPGHETVHAVRGENGDKQGFKLLGEGVNDYMKTEEGAGAVAEMILGEAFGDDRQVKFAARYLAVAMALKAKEVNGEIVPQYTIQQIHDYLRENGVNAADSEDIVWRICRGTSLRHQGLRLPVKTMDGIKQIPSAECYPKDVVYFEGQMEVFNWIKDKLPFAEGQERSETVGSLDFSEQFLVRLGRAVEIMSDIEPGENHQLVDNEKRLIGEGRAMLLDLLRMLCKGKMRLDFLSPQSEWFKDFVNEGLVDYTKILEPKN